MENFYSLMAANTKVKSIMASVTEKAILRVENIPTRVNGNVERSTATGNSKPKKVNFFFNVMF